MASAAIARAAAVGPTVAAPQAHANSSLLSAKALALDTKRVLARRAPACADKTRDGGDGDGGDNDWDNAAGERAPGARGNEVKGQGVQLAASAQQHQCNGKSCSGVCVQASATYNDMLQRFDEMLLLELDSPTIVNEYGSAAEESIDELLDAFDSLELKLNSYAAQLSLVGLKQADESAPGEKQSARQQRPSMVSFSPVSVVHNFHVDDDERQSKVDAYTAVMEQAPANRAESELELAATRAQAAVRGHLTRLGLAEAGALYTDRPCQTSGSAAVRTLRASVPPDVCICRVHGGLRAYDFALCRCAALAIPLSISEVLVLLSSQTTAPEPPALTGPGGCTHGKWHPADAMTSPKVDKWIKGAAARKAAAAAAHNKLRAARQAALAAKTRVTVVSGELYYFCSAALGAAEAADAVRRGAASELDQALASEAELLVRYLHPGVTAAEVREIFAQWGPLTYVRIECSTYADTPKEHKLGLEYNVATIGFVHGIDAAGARIALDNEDLLRSGCIKVDFCAGHEHDVTMDDELDEGDFDGSDDMGFGDEMDF